jgi:flagellar biosynthesis component FlhA
MNKASRLMFKLLAIVLFLLAIASILATLFTVSGSSRSPGLFFAVVLAGIGKWLLGKSQGKSAQETFGRAIEIAEPRNE